MIKLRAATMEDWARLFAWRNDEETRRQSETTAAVPLKAHMDWLRDTLNSKTRHLYIASDDGALGLIGTVRLDVKKKRAEVSITIDPRRRGKGDAQTVIACAVHQAVELDLDFLDATVRTSNLASLRAFAANQFVPLRYRDEEGFVDLVREV